MPQKVDKFYKQIQDYCEKFTTPASTLLKELERETYLKTLAPQMISGPLQGTFLRFLSLMLRPKCIVEIGTFTGYGALCLAQGMAPGGVLHTIEANPELEYLIRKYIQKAGMENTIQVHLGQAQDVIPALPGPFDLVYLDAGKLDYPVYYELVIDKMQPGSWLLADNMLWSGKVIQNAGDADTLSLQNFAKKIMDDPRVENTILPIRDGLLLVRKIEG